MIPKAASRREYSRMWVQYSSITEWKRMLTLKKHQELTVKLHEVYRRIHAGRGMDYSYYRPQLGLTLNKERKSCKLCPYNWWLLSGDPNPTSDTAHGFFCVASRKSQFSIFVQGCNQASEAWCRSFARRVAAKLLDPPTPPRNDGPTDRSTWDPKAYHTVKSHMFHR